MNGTLMNYYFHCKRQCYLHGNRINMEDNSEDVKIGKAIHEEKAMNSANTEISIENIKLDKLTMEYLTEIKKSDADEEASKWQLLYYLWVLKSKGIVRKGKIQYIEKNKKESRIEYFELGQAEEVLVEKYIAEIEELIANEFVPEVIKSNHCKKCSYYEYCFI